MAEFTEDLQGSSSIVGQESSGDAMQCKQDASVEQDVNVHVKRAKHSCPVPSCSSFVVHLPRHMRTCHKWSPRKSSSVLNAFSLRKDKRQTSAKQKRYYKSRICPVRGCNSIIKRIHNHLRDVHGAKPGSKAYVKALRNAVPHEIGELSPTTSSDGSSSTISSLSAESFEEKVKKLKKEKHAKNLSSLFQDIYGSNSNDDDDVPRNERKANDGEISLPSEEEFGRDFEEDIGGDLFQEDDSMGNPAHLNDNLPHDHLFTGFEEWLEGPDGGRKDKHCAVQCRRQLQLLVKYMDPGSPNLANIFLKTALRDKWLTPFEKERQPGTIKSYLGVLNQFYIFLKCEHICVGPSEDELSNLSNQVKLWAKSYRKLSQDRFWEKRMEDLIKIRTPGQIKEFETSDTARFAIKTIGEYTDYEGELPPSQPEYTGVRDYILTVLCINNAGRSGAFSNMTLDEFHMAVIDEDGYFMVKVKKHKTFTTHGPVHIVFTPTLYKYAEIFVKKFRNLLPNVDEKLHVFLTWRGSEMNSSQIGAQIDSCWAKVFGKESSGGGATAFRKAAVSAVHETSKDMREDLADLMVHKRSTADRFYVLQDKGKKAVKTSKKLTEIMRATHTCSNQKTKEKASSCVAADDSPSQDVTADDSPSRHKWTDSEVAIVKQTFKENIEEKSITLPEVRSAIKNQPTLSKIPPVKIRNKVRSYFKDTDKSVQEDMDESNATPLLNESESQSDLMKRFGLELTSAETSKEKENKQDGDDGSEYSLSIIPPTSTSQKSRQLLTEEDNELFKKTFHSLINSSANITQKIVYTKLQKQTRLAHLEKQCTFRQLADKIRTERRIIARQNEGRKKKGKE